MPKFHYKAKNKYGHISKGILIATDENDLRRMLNAQEYYLIYVRKIQESSQMFAFLEKIKTRHLTSFCRKFAIMINAGIPIVDSIGNLMKTSESRKLRGLLENVYNDLLIGKLLSESFGRYPKTFPAFFRNMVYIGEISGNLDVIMVKLANYYEKDSRIKQKAKSALIYPAILVCLVVFVLIALLLFVLPQFKELISQLGGEMPLITRIVMDTSDFISENFPVIALGAMLLWIFIWVFGKTKTGRKFYDKAKLTLPVIKRVNVSVLTSRFARGFGTLLSSGIQIIEAMNVMSNLLGNKVVEEKFQFVCEEIKVGQPIAKSIEAINVFPSMLTEMVSVGEMTGELDNILNTTADYFDDQVDVSISRMTAMIEPTLIIVIGIIVALVILSIFLPIMSIMQSIG
jgi:type IV pilus assembly protein PilC